uniref:Uncharacterized protein n=1 Tax=Attheya septentrionalis TaxID=420275 RepID=A0A7S2UMP1_9STRA|mmetsp:Transcript_29565/g.54175  ORF Transcript_29565/g.54175 Transcript_29565/m.54175 type:complete len:242 (+) Transcript_29565:144-869(+)|eukprot:CAMPEP_0198281500 /NCGR_PEP_ID=MMETSP1449-20131203/1419_1 /TAXON_ID=420275 /ORGANISM="Attheya septentrionalis, Strain CCMP2084" /LENGTH=241 /DNA_ID=CAMNT_0043977289 /DNA_START=124 /DNA_END=849 /DNA_ORIENTATION=+
MMIETKRRNMTVGRVATVLVVLVVTGVEAFAPLRSSFAGRVTSVCRREELTTELSCPPTRTSTSSSTQRHANMSMPPFLQKLGFKKPPKDDEEEETAPAVTTIVESPDGEQVTALESSVPEDEKELSETEKLLKKVKESGTAGIVSYALWELVFWAISVPVCVFGYVELTGHWPDFSNAEDLEKLGAEAFAFVNFARFAVPLRIGLALSTTPWIQKNVVDKFKKDNEDEDGASSSTTTESE